MSTDEIKNKHLEMFSLIWLDSNPKDDDRNTEQKLRSIINQLRRFQNVSQCQEFIEKTSATDRLILIVSGQSGKELLPKIHHIRQIISIYVYCTDKKTNEEWSSKYCKIKNIIVDLDELISTISNDYKIETKIEEPLAINIFSVGGKSTSGLNGKFVFSQVLIDCLLRLESTDQDRNELLQLLKQEYKGNTDELYNIKNFELKYQSNEALRWYTKESFFYRTLNSVLRTENIHFIFLYRSFIFDLQQQLQKYPPNKILTVYRAQIISKDELQQLKELINQFISVNSFFPTTLNHSKALYFFQSSKSIENTERILFKIQANPNISKIKPFANISHVSNFPYEEEVLFMIGSIFQLKNISFDKKNQCSIVEMILSSDDDNQLKQVLAHMKQQTKQRETNLRILATILSDMGRFDLAQTYLERFLKQILLNDSLRGDLYEDLATVASRSGNLDKSMEWHKKSIEFKHNHPNAFSAVYINVDQTLAEMKNLMIQIDKLQEYTMPHYFFILPAKDYDLTMIDNHQILFHLHFKLYFLCPCSNDPKEFHIVRHHGYSIKRFKEFIAKYGEYLKVTINLVQVLTSIEEETRLQKTHTLTTVQPTTSIRSENYLSNINYKINFIQNFLHKSEIKRMYTDISVNAKNTSDLCLIRKVDFEELENYLERNDSTELLSNLHRIITFDGQIKWICEKDYDAICLNKVNNDFIKEIKNISSDFNQANRQLTFSQLKLTSANIRLLLQILTKGFIISSVSIQNCSIYESDFYNLTELILSHSSIQSIEINNLEILKYFGFYKYIYKFMNASFCNQLLTINFNQSFEVDTKYLFTRFLQQSKNYRALQLSADDFEKHDQQLAECLDTSTQFNRLILNNGCVTTISKSISTLINKQIQHLKLTNSSKSAWDLTFSDDLIIYWNDICELLKTNLTIVELDLIDSANYFSEQHLRYLFEILKEHKSIKRLRLHISTMGYADNKETLLIDFLQNYPHLTHLTLHESDISLKLIQSLIDTIHKYHSITYLTFHQCYLDENQIEQLKLLETTGLLCNLSITSQQTSTSLKSITSKLLKQTVSTKISMYSYCIVLDSDYYSTIMSHIIIFIRIILICFFLYEMSYDSLREYYFIFKTALTYIFSFFQ